MHVNRFQRRRLALLAPIAAAAAVAAIGTASAGGASVGHASARVSGRGLPYVPDQVVVQYRPGTTRAAAGLAARAAGATDAGPLPGGTRLLKLRPGHSVESALRAARAQREVALAVPDYRVSAADFIPNDPGYGGVGGWQRVQWNFEGPYGVNAPAAWGIARQAHAGAGRGVTVAVIDSGVAFENHGSYRRSPDLFRSTFVAPWDFLRHNAHPDDAEDHGTFVASEIAEATNNHRALTGLAYDAKIMPLRILDASGQGDGATLAKAVYYAVAHHAQVINLSVQVDSHVNASGVPEIVAAMRYAYSHNVVVVAAAGNGTPTGRSSLSYPGAGPGVISVGATTSDGCLADYSNYGQGLTLVAPGGGDDAALTDDAYDSAHCNPDRNARNVTQLTFTRNPRHFGFAGFAGTSFSTPHVSAAVAMLLAMHKLGPHPTPAAVKQRLGATARRLGSSTYYGAGLLNIAALLGS